MKKKKKPGIVANTVSPWHTIFFIIIWECSIKHPGHTCLPFLSCSPSTTALPKAIKQNPQSPVCVAHTLIGEWSNSQQSVP